MTDSHGRRYGKASRITKKSTTPTPVAAVMPRSVSMSTLPTLSVESLKPRISCLESLEAKMANIEVSLSNDHQPRKKSLQNNRSISNNKYEVGQLQLQDINLANEKMTKLIKEIELLRKGLLEKDSLITELKKQNGLLEQEKQNKENGERETQPVVKKTDVEVKQERLKEIQKEMDDKQTIIKNLQLSMEKMEANDLDGRIHQAELEFQQEREELELLNLQQEHLAVKAFLEEKTVENKSQNNNVKNVTFFSLLKYNRCATLVAVEVPYNPQSPNFVIAAHSSGRGLFVQWSRENSSLKKGDRLVEVNGHFLLNCTREDLIVILSKTSITIPLQVTVLRNSPQSSARWVNACELENLKDEVATVINKLDAKNRENKNLHVVIEKLKSENGKFQNDNLKLTHRIMYLEDQVGDLQRSWEDLRSTLNQADLTSAHSSNNSNSSISSKHSKRIIRIEDNNSFHSLPYHSFSENVSVRRSGSMGKMVDVKSPSLLKNAVTGTTSISVNQSKTTVLFAPTNGRNAVVNGRKNYDGITTVSHNNNTNGCDYVSVSYSKGCLNDQHERKSLHRSVSNNYQDDTFNSDNSSDDVTFKRTIKSEDDTLNSFTTKSKSTSCVPLYLNSQTKETNATSSNRKQNPLCSSKSTSHIGSENKKSFSSDRPPSLNVHVSNSPIMKSHSFSQLDHVNTVVSKGNAHILQVHVPFSQSNAVETRSLQKIPNERISAHPMMVRTNSSPVVENSFSDSSIKNGFHLHRDGSSNVYKETAEISLKPSTMPFHLKMNRNKIALDDFESDHEQWC